MSRQPFKSRPNNRPNDVANKSIGAKGSVDSKQKTVKKGIVILKTVFRHYFWGLVKAITIVKPTAFVSIYIIG